MYSGSRNGPWGNRTSNYTLERDESEEQGNSARLNGNTKLVLFTLLLFLFCEALIYYAG
jgi:hypothetical protein